MHIQCLNAQHIGKRSRQEDAFAFSDATDIELVQRGGVLAVVADGMGGLADGDKASSLATDAFLDNYVRTVTAGGVDVALLQSLHIANVAVNDYALSAGGADSTGTTLTAAAIVEHELHWVSVGDSRLYVYNRGVLRQLTMDHTLAQDLDKAVLAGALASEIAASHPEREALTSCLGMAQLERVNVGSCTLTDDDVVLLCSDGLYKTLEEKRIVRVLKRAAGSPVEALLHAVEKENRDRQDNVTVLAMIVASATKANAPSFLRRGIGSIGSVSRHMTRGVLQRARRLAGSRKRNKAEGETPDLTEGNEHTEIKGDNPV